MDNKAAKSAKNAAVPAAKGFPEERAATRLGSDSATPDPSSWSNLTSKQLAAHAEQMDKTDKVLAAMRAKWDADYKGMGHADRLSIPVPDPNRMPEPPTWDPFENTEADTVVEELKAQHRQDQEKRTVENSTLKYLTATVLLGLLILYMVARLFFALT